MQGFKVDLFGLLAGLLDVIREFERFFGDFVCDSWVLLFGIAVSCALSYTSLGVVQCKDGTLFAANFMDVLDSP